jgi:tetratricopeptide (TPR) repeat protein
VTQQLEALNNQVLLGDMRFKQGRYRDAVSAYEEAVPDYVRILKMPLLFAGVPKQDSLHSYLSGADLYSKLAQAYFKLGEQDKALDTLKKMAEAAQTADRLAGTMQNTLATPADSRPASITLAPKLTISVSKHLCDQVATGKLTFAEFKKAATVEYLPFAEEAKPARP